MKHKKTITIITVLIMIISAFASATGIFSDAGPGEYIHESVRGKQINIYGQGVYRHMSADVAIQGIAQDYVTLFIGIPLLLIFLLGYRKDSLKYHYLLAGTMGYFLVTYMFYTAMAMYNELFLTYVCLMGLSFFGLLILLTSLSSQDVRSHFTGKAPVRLAGGFLLFNAVSIALFWLSIVLPPLFDGSLVPPAVEHYTTLIVQGFDLGLLLPMAVVSAWLLLRKKAQGYLFSTVYLMFLSLLMTALTAKLIAMSLNGVSVIPAIFIIPLFNAMSILCIILMARNIISPHLDRPVVS